MKTQTNNQHNEIWTNEEIDYYLSQRVKPTTERQVILKAEDNLGASQDRLKSANLPLSDIFYSDTPLDDLEKGLSSAYSVQHPEVNSPQKSDKTLSDRRGRYGLDTLDSASNSVGVHTQHYIQELSRKIWGNYRRTQ
jgi:hypothetical protein